MVERWRSVEEGSGGCGGEPKITGGGGGPAVVK